MIWLWIAISLILSYLPLANKKIDLANYIWLLVPIDGYGISLAGFTVKPYMIFALVIPIILYARNKGKEFSLSISKGQILAGIICISIFTLSLINTNDFQAVSSSIILLIAYISAQLSTSSFDCDKSEQLSDVLIASCFGCSIIFIVAYLCFHSGLQLDGIVTPARAQSGMFMKTSNMSNGQYIEAFRLRGFAYDPNGMFPQFIFGITACIARLFKKFKLYYVFTLITSIICILLSSSRMGLLCCITSIAITCVICIIQIEGIKKKVLCVISILSLCTFTLIISISRWGQQIITSLLSTYSNRSSLTDEYGRFSIWKECLEIYWDENPLFGVGLNQMSKLTETARMTHNTWLCFICECGAIIGLAAIIYFLSVAVIGWVNIKANRLNHPDNTSYITLVIGYTMVLIALISVDNIANSYLWFSGLLVLKMAQYAKTKPINKQEILRI